MINRKRRRWFCYDELLPALSLSKYEEWLWYTRVTIREHQKNIYNSHTRSLSIYLYLIRFLTLSDDFRDGISLRFFRKPLSARNSRWFNQSHTMKNSISVCRNQFLIILFSTTLSLLSHTHSLSLRRFKMKKEMRHIILSKRNSLCMRLKIDFAWTLSIFSCDTRTISATNFWQLVSKWQTSWNHAVVSDVCACVCWWFFLRQEEPTQQGGRKKKS